MEYREYYILIAINVLFPVACFTTYTIAVLYGHVHAVFPYISDTGALAPESCVFGFFMGIYALLTARAIMLRYKLVDSKYGNGNGNRINTTTSTSASLSTGNNNNASNNIDNRNSNCNAISTVNKLALVTGWAASLGIYIVGNFQTTNVVSVHLIGAFLAFIVGNVCMWLQTVLSFKRELPGYSLGLTRLRLVLSILNTIGIVVFLSLAFVSRNLKLLRPLYWGPELKGYTEHVTATFIQWIVAFITTAFFLTFYKEFDKFKVKEELIFK